MKKTHIICAVGLALMLGSCNVYKSYTRPEVSTEGLYRDPQSATDTLRSDTVSVGNLPWREVFTDPALQTLIEQGLERNANLQTARLNIEQAEASLRSARLAYTPSLNLAPQGGVTTLLDGSKSMWTWSAPAAFSWEVDLFGKLLNAKRAAKAQLMQSVAYRQAVQTQLIAGIANYYYTLLMLDRQLEISQHTAQLWRENVETMRALKQGSTSVTEAAVVQSEANCYSIEASIPELERQIREAENALSLLLYEAPQQIHRGAWSAIALPEMMQAGVPIQLLANRPDVKAAEMTLASAFYGTAAARAAFYPSLTLSGTVGWTNTAGGIVSNPAQAVLSAVAGLAQPLFNKGGNTARLRVAKAQQQQAMIAFQQSLLNAGSEVSNALMLYSVSQQKLAKRTLQVAALQKSVEYTQELMKYGSSTYLEVLTAQQSLLSAQLSEVNDSYQRIQSVINLYSALGGGREDEAAQTKTK